MNLSCQYAILESGNSCLEVSKLGCRPEQKTCGTRLLANTAIRLWMKHMYLRFVVAELDENSNMELGVFHAIRNLREEGKLLDFEEEQHELDSRMVQRTS